MVDVVLIKFRIYGNDAVENCVSQSKVESNRKVYMDIIYIHAQDFQRVV